MRILTFCFIILLPGLVFTGCHECDPEYQEKDRLYDSMLRNPIMRFYDGSGNEMTMTFEGESYITVHSPTQGDCNYGPSLWYFPQIDFRVTGQAVGIATATYETMNDEFRLDTGRAYGIMGPIGDTTVRGHLFTDCTIATRTYADSVQNVLIFNQDHGIILLSQTGFIHWERDLD